MGTTNRIPNKCNHTQSCIQSRILFFLLSLPKSESKENACTVSFNPFIPWTGQVITRKLCLLSSSIFPKFLALCLVFPFVSYLPCILCYYCSCENPSEWRDQESHFSTRLSRTPSLWLVSGKLFSYFVCVAGVLFSSSARIFMTGQSSFVLGQKIVWTNIGKESYT